MLETAIVAARDRTRLIDVASIFIRYGVDGLVDQLNLRKLLPQSQQRIDAQHEELSQPERLRKAIEALGPTYIKLGQILATRHDLLGPEWTGELAKLHSSVEPLPWSLVFEQIHEDLNGDPYQVFASFDEQPIAAASIAQVYKATLHSGEQVVLKVRRPKLRPVIEADLRLLSHIARLLQQSSDEWKRYRPLEIVSYLGAAMRDELDFAREGHYCDEVARNFESDPTVVIPKIYWEWTSERLLVQEFIEGYPPIDAKQLRGAGLDPHALARRGAKAILQMVLEDGVFHADPHPGNMIAMAENRVGFIDFGMVGRLSERRKHELLILFRALVEGRADGVASMLLSWSDQYDSDPVALNAATERFLARHGIKPLKISHALSDFMSLARELHIALPTDLSLLFKAFITADGVLLRMDPTLDIVAVAQPLVQSQMTRQYSPRALRRRATYLAAEFYDLAADMPGYVRLLMHRLRHGRVGVDLEVRHMRDLGQSLERAATRLCIAVVTAAFALGLAPHLINLGPSVFGVPLFTLLGIAATLCGSGLLLFWLWWRR
ncbi:AarF/UbiB family protein [Paenalcaligenes niemegkensis]|uniref:ABC1 kinase family protein n=1 Tax=Paenalcaligenes niemegkensis TaxID=2895469 RepID=UPI001EE9122C|nr:AarF/UbiB family protein [Paenalcaligenes niemegkensis]MCQ9615362.1 AarF/UbiB family protein [Paenalcaligenes niemegkensis]